MQKNTRKWEMKKKTEKKTTKCRNAILMILVIFYHHLCLYFYTRKRSKRHRIMSWWREVVNLCFNPIAHAHSSMPLMCAIMIFWRKLLQMFFRKGEKKPQTHTHRKKKTNNTTVRKAERSIRSIDAEWATVHWFQYCFMKFIYHN